MSVEVFDQLALLAEETPRVFVTLLGMFAVTVAGQPAKWKGNGAGRRQLKRAFAYLIAHLGEPVSYETLLETAGGRSGKSRKHVWNGVQTMLRSWGMEDALIVREHRMTLRRHPSWQSDADRLRELSGAAAQAHEREQLDQAIALMEAAGALCGGRYLQLFEHDLDLALEGDAGLWHDEQKQVFKALAQWLLERAAPGDAKKAYQAAQIALRFDRYDWSCCEIVIVAARQFGNEELARRYEEKLRRMK